MEDTCEEERGIEKGVEEEEEEEEVEEWQLEE